ncbi:MAG TPA: universal stress protein [Dissulfurispiraceae bacterium]|nr:universal stress protein [Dissulfurispiraceae bacterium]
MIIKNILFPTDFSEGAAHALSYAVDLAKTYKAKLYIAHVIQDIDVSSNLHIPHQSVDVLFNEFSTSAKKGLDKLCVSVQEECKGIETFTLRGIPYEEILKFAPSKNIDLIVMATHGRKGLDRVLFGSTAERVVRNSSCPVLTIRMP